MTNCQACAAPISIPQKHQALLEDLKINTPKFCYRCSWKRKMQWQNDYQIYPRTCSATNKNIISIYKSDVPFPVYEREYWFSDEWEAPHLKYDSEKSFFDQYFELFKIAPRPHKSQVNTVNSDYTNLVFESKDCYLTFQAFRSEKLLYCYRSHRLRESMNCFFCSDSELLFEATNCNKCYNLKFSQDCSGCSDSSFLFDCKSCSDCFLCWNLRNKKNCILNKQYTPQEYQKHIQNIDLQKALKLYAENKPNFIKKAAYILSSENCQGDFLVNCNNCEECYFTDGSEDCFANIRATENKDCYDTVVGGLAELSYNLLQPGWIYHSAYASACNHCQEIYFSENCDTCTECIGCIGLRNKKFCILNKSYPEKEYFELKKQILTKLIDEGDEEFFNPSRSPFDYDETLADLYFPKNYQPTEILPSAFISSDQLNESSFNCHTCQKPFNVTEQEISFTKKLQTQIPHDCFRCRIKRLAQNYSQINPQNIPCHACGTETLTNFAGFFDKIYCEDCYLHSID